MKTQTLVVIAVAGVAYLWWKSSKKKAAVPDVADGVPSPAAPAHEPVHATDATSDTTYSLPAEVATAPLQFGDAVKRWWQSTFGG